MSKNQAAFPSPGIVIDHGTNQAQQGAYEGMSLRDYFAAKFLSGRAAVLGYVDPKEDATMAYSVADAMLAAREVSK